MAKLLKLRRGTTSQHNTFTGAEGEVTIDTTKDTAVVHDGAQAGGRPLAREDMSNVSSSSIAGRLGADAIATTKIAGGTLPSDVKITDSNVSGNLTIVSADIVDGSIVNADVNASAAIAGTKIAPNFGSQNVATTGTLAAGATTVTGNLAVSGTVDGVDVAGQNTLMRSVVASTANLNNGVTATTQAQSDNSTKVATTAYVKSAVANVVDSAPGALDTLNELAAALGDDANFATTTANSIGTKLPKSGGQMTGNITMSGSQTVDGRDLSVDGAKLDGIESGATADQSASEILNLVKTVDGTNSGLDADLLRGLNAGQFLRSDTAHTAQGDITFSGGAGAITVSGGSDLRIAGGTWTGEYNGGIKIQPDATNSYFQFKGSLFFRRGSDGSNRLQLDSSGNLTAQGNVTAYSDARLKTNIHTINDALGICGKLRGVSFNWIADNKPSIGVIAQEVEEVLPELVLTNQDVNPVTQEITEIKSVDYGKIVGVLINAINELKAEVDELKGGK